MPDKRSPLSARLPARPGWAPVMHKRPRSWRFTSNPYPNGRSVTTTFRVRSTSTNCWRTEAAGFTMSTIAAAGTLVTRLANLRGAASPGVFVTLLAGAATPANKSNSARCERIVLVRITGYF
eukprot:9500502-Pyramimonas_sp.AAC.1